MLGIRKNAPSLFRAFEADGNYCGSDAPISPEHQKEHSSIPTRATPKCWNRGEGRVGSGTAEEEVEGDDRIPYEEERMIQ